MQGEKAQIIITDPPYNCSINGHVCGLGKIKHDEFENASGEMTEPEFAEFISKFMQNLIKFSVDGSLHYLFMDFNGLNRLIEISPRYCDVIIYRWRQETGKTAKLVKNYKELENGVR